MLILGLMDDTFYCFKLYVEEGEDSNRNRELNGAFGLNWEQLGFQFWRIY